jgi:hypothetical protein
MKTTAFALLLALLPLQDKVTLKFNPKKGDKLSKIERNEMAIKAKVTAGDQEQEIEFGQRDVQDATTEYLEVVDGAVTKSQVDCKEHHEEKKGPPTLQWEKKEKPLHGRKVTLSLVDGKLVREGADGLDDKTLRKLELADKASHLFPKTAVAPGDTWEVTEEDARKFFAKDDDLREVKVKGKLLAVKEIDGRRCAVMNIVMDLKGKAPNGVDLAILMDAESVVWIERGYTLSVKGKGTVTMKAENPQFKMLGEGPVTLDIAVKVE